MKRKKGMDSERKRGEIERERERPRVKLLIQQIAGKSFKSATLFKSLTVYKNAIDLINNVIRSFR